MSATQIPEWQKRLGAIEAELKRIYERWDNLPTEMYDRYHCLLAEKEALKANYGTGVTLKTTVNNECSK